MLRHNRTRYHAPVTFFVLLLSSSVVAVGQPHLRVTGPATPVSRVSDGRLTQPRWSPDGRSLAARRDGIDDIRIVDLGNGGIRSISVEAGAALGFAWSTDASAPRPDVFPEEVLLNVTPSPDGSLVAFEVLGGNTFVADVARPDIPPTDLGRGYRPRWSPDGDWIVYMRTTDDGEQYTSSDIVAVHVANRTEIRLTDSPDRLEMNPSWSPDGFRIAFDDLSDGLIHVLPVARTAE